MTSAGSSEDEEADHEFVVCASCGARASTDWSFCRSCQSSLEDAHPPEDPLERIGADDTIDMEESGCPKCGHEDAEVDAMATTGTALTRLFDLQVNRFQVVTCTNCGYTEFYRGPNEDWVLDLFLGG